MPADKNKIERLRILDKMLKDPHRFYTFDDLLSTLKDEMVGRYNTSISVRTLRSDIKDLREFVKGKNSIITTPGNDGKKRFYRYENDTYTMFSTALSENEYTVIQNALKTLSKYRGLDGYNWLDNSLLNLEFKFGFRPSHRKDEEVVSFQSVENSGSNKWLSTVIDATTMRTPLSIVYKPFGKEEREWTIHPWYVKQYNNRWFLFGYVEEEEELRNVALDRIQKLETTTKYFKRNRDINFKRYFDDVIGVSIPREDQVVEDIILKFSPWRFPYVKTKPMHKSQKVMDEEQGIIKLSVIQNRELEAQILSFGKDVEVLAPESLRNRIKENIEKTLSNY